jgi:hypothetical protein
MKEKLNKDVQKNLDLQTQIEALKKPLKPRPPQHNLTQNPPAQHV